MNFVSGHLARFIQEPEGELKGILLEDGLEVRFSTELAIRASSVLKQGCSVRIEGVPCSDGSQKGYLQAALVVNLDSNQMVALPPLKHKGKPGMQANNTPVNATSLVPLENPGRLETDIPSTEHALEASALPPASFFNELLHEEHQENGKSANFQRNDAARSISLAYDSLHRIQAILAYLHIMRHCIPGISQFLDEAKHTYEQALSRFSTPDFVSAKEFAEASSSLSRVVEIIMGRTLRADSTLPSLVPPPPKHVGTAPEPEHVEEDMARAESVLSRIHWVLEHGTLPSEDRAQVRKIASWGDAFYKQAQRTYRNAVLEDASEFAQAALAGAYSAEHVCRKWYANHPANS